jgi:hypothetical protein
LNSAKPERIVLKKQLEDGTDKAGEGDENETGMKEDSAIDDS